MDNLNFFPNITDLSPELLCNILKNLPLKEILSVCMLCKKLSVAVNMHLKLCKIIDFCPDTVSGYMPSSITDSQIYSLFKRCPQLEKVYGLHPIKEERKRLRNRSALTIPGIIRALRLCTCLKAIETSDLRLLEAIMQHFPQIEIIGHFQNRDSAFPPLSSQKLKLQSFPRIRTLNLIGDKKDVCLPPQGYKRKNKPQTNNSSFYLYDSKYTAFLPPDESLFSKGVEVPELTPMPYLENLSLEYVRFTKLQPFRIFSAQNLSSFSMKHCMGPSMSLRYLPLVIALSSCPKLKHLELSRVPLPGGLFQRAVEDSHRQKGFVGLETLAISGCKGILEADLGHLMIVSSKNLIHLCIQPSLTKDSLFVSLSFAQCEFPCLKSLHLGYIDSLNHLGEWSNDDLLSLGLADVPDTPSSITDSGMKTISEIFPHIETLTVSNCPHLILMYQWMSNINIPSWSSLQHLTLQKNHCLELPSFTLFVSLLPSIRVIVLIEMFKEPPKGCSHVGLSAGTGLGMSSAIVSNQDEHMAVQGNHQEFDHPGEEENGEVIRDFIDEDNQEPHFMVLRGDFFEDDDDFDYIDYEARYFNEYRSERDRYNSDDMSELSDVDADSDRNSNNCNLSQPSSPNPNNSENISYITNKNNNTISSKYKCYYYCYEEIPDINDTSKSTNGQIEDGLLPSACKQSVNINLKPENSSDSDIIPEETNLTSGAKYDPQKPSTSRAGKYLNYSEFSDISDSDNCNNNVLKVKSNKPEKYLSLKNSKDTKILKDGNSLGKSDDNCSESDEYENAWSLKMSKEKYNNCEFNDDDASKGKRFFFFNSNSDVTKCKPKGFNFTLSDETRSILNDKDLEKSMKCIVLITKIDQDNVISELTSRKSTEVSKNIYLHADNYQESSRRISSYDNLNNTSVCSYSKINKSDDETCDLMEDDNSFCEKNLAKSDEFFEESTYNLNCESGNVKNVTSNIVSSIATCRNTENNSSTENYDFLQKDANTSNYSENQNFSVKLEQEESTSITDCSISSDENKICKNVSIVLTKIDNHMLCNGGLNSDNLDKGEILNIDVCCNAPTISSMGNSYADDDSFQKPKLEKYSYDPYQSSSLHPDCSLMCGDTSHNKYDDKLHNSEECWPNIRMKNCMNESDFCISSITKGCYVHIRKLEDEYLNSCMKSQYEKIKNIDCSKIKVPEGNILSTPVSVSGNAKIDDHMLCNGGLNSDNLDKGEILNIDVCCNAPTISSMGNSYADDDSFQKPKLEKYSYDPYQSSSLYPDCNLMCEDTSHNKHQNKLHNSEECRPNIRMKNCMNENDFCISGITKSCYVHLKKLKDVNSCMKLQYEKIKNIDCSKIKIPEGNILPNSVTILGDADSSNNVEIKSFNNHDTLDYSISKRLKKELNEPQHRSDDDDYYVLVPNDPLEKLKFINAATSKVSEATKCSVVLETFDTLSVQSKVISEFIPSLPSTSRIQGSFKSNENDGRNYVTSEMVMSTIGVKDVKRIEKPKMVNINARVENNCIPHDLCDINSSKTENCVGSRSKFSIDSEAEISKIVVLKIRKSDAVLMSDYPEYFQPVSNRDQIRKRKRSSSENNTKSSRKRLAVGKLQKKTKFTTRSHQKRDKKQSRKMEISIPVISLISQGTQANSAGIRRTLRRVRQVTANERRMASSSIRKTNSQRSSKISAKVREIRPKYGNYRCKTQDKSTSTSDPLLEDDAVQSLLLSSETLCNVTIVACGISDFTLERCPNLYHLEVEACRILKEFTLSACPSMRIVNISQCPKLNISEISSTVLSLTTDFSLMVSYEPCMQNYHFGDGEREILSKVGPKQSVILFHDFHEPSSENVQEYNKKKIMDWATYLYQLHSKLNYTRGKFKKEQKSYFSPQYPWSHDLRRKHGEYVFSPSSKFHDTAGRYSLLTNNPILADAFETCKSDKEVPSVIKCEAIHNQSLLSFEAVEKYFQMQKKTASFYIPITEYNRAETYKLTQPESSW